MPCYYPLTAYYGRGLTALGKRQIVFKKQLSVSGVSFELPCGQCVGCRLEHARQWAVRCVHESKLHDTNCFLTLTYRDADLPDDGSLDKRHLQLFMKRLRKMFVKGKPAYGKGIRFFGAGEYGSISGRPHYHLLLFNFDFPDKKFWKNSDAGEPLFRSDLCNDLWLYGDNVIGSVTFKSASYVAGYVVDKINGPKADDHYLSGDGVLLQSEFSLKSLKPGIGSLFFDKFNTEIYRDDTVIMNGAEFAPPRFYDKKYEALDSDRLKKLKSIRRRRALLRSSDNTRDRRRVREIVAIRQLQQFRRDMK